MRQLLHPVLSRSTKAIGRFEGPLIEVLAAYYRGLRFSVFPHVQLNLAWASIISDVDLLVMKDGAFTAIEVKSRHDHPSRAEKQLTAISDYIDYAYVAVERPPKDWCHHEFGLLQLNEGTVECVKKASRLSGEPRRASLICLHRRCVCRWLGEAADYLSKSDVVDKIIATSKVNRNCLKVIATCGKTCEEACPIWRFVDRPQVNVVQVSA